MHPVTTTTTINTTSVESNPSWHVLIPHPHTHAHLWLQVSCSSAVSPAVHLCLSSTPVIPGSPSGAANPHRVFASLSHPPLLSPSPSLFLSLSLSVLLSSSTCGGNSLFNSLQHQPINSFADGWLAPADAG